MPGDNYATHIYELWSKILQVPTSIYLFFMLRGHGTSCVEFRLFYHNTLSRLHLFPFTLLDFDFLYVHTYLRSRFCLSFPSFSNSDMCTQLQNFFQRCEGILRLQETAQFNINIKTWKYFYLGICFHMAPHLWRLYKVWEVGSSKKKLWSLNLTLAASFKVTKTFFKYYANKLA
jgi:hypothetical protein